MNLQGCVKIFLSNLIVTKNFDLQEFFRMEFYDNVGFVFSKARNENINQTCNFAACIS
jgi:hypothetical protein